MLLALLPALLVLGLVGAASALTSGSTALLVASVVASIVVGGLLVVVARSISQGVLAPLHRLREASTHIAGTLHDTVVKAASGDDTGTHALLATLDTDLTTRTDELGDLARALVSATREATAVAVEQAQTRHGAAQTISNVARREQSLVERQLTLLEIMEATEEDPTVLSQLFQLDHLAARMRRNAENLLLLSVGQMPGAGDTEHLPLVDVLRSAAAETEDYARVDVRCGLPLDVLSYAATPLSHLLAELIENATSFSPPHTRVAVTVRRAEPDGVLVTIADKGLGMSPEDLEDARARLLAPPVIEAAESRQLGLYVVGLLATRMGVAVDMRAGDGGGLEVHVLLPDTIFTGTTDARPGPSGLAAQVAAGRETVPEAAAGTPTSPVAVDAPEIPDFDLPELDGGAGASPLSSQTPSGAGTALPSRGASPAGAVGAAAQPAADADVPSSHDPLEDIPDVADLLDALPATSAPPLPADVPQARAEHLPTRAAGSHEQPAESRSGLSMASASGGATAEVDPMQMSALMRSFSAAFDDDASAGAPSPAAPAVAAEPVQPPPPDPVQSAAPAAHAPAAQHTAAPQAAVQHATGQRTGATAHAPNPTAHPRRASAWSTPFEPKDKR